MVLSENSCTGKPEVDCPTVGAVERLGTCKQNGNAISYRNTKGAGKKPAPKGLDLCRYPKRVMKSSVQDGLGENEKSTVSETHKFHN